MDGAEFRLSGCCRSCLRWVGLSAALWIDWKVAASFWSLSECSWVLEWGRGSLERDIAEAWISGQNGLQVFEVNGSGCGGG